MISKKFLAGIAGVAAVVVISGTMVTSSYSSFISKDRQQNKFKNGTVDIENVETIDKNGTAFSNVESWNASKPTPKIVKIHNKSRSPALIRTAISPRWVNEDNTPFAGDTTMVTIKYTANTNWIKGNDGYYYYKEIVPTNNDTESLIESVSANVPEKLAARYKGKKLIVDVRSESVLAGKASDGKAVYTKTWSVTDKKITSMLNKLSGINA